MNTTKSKKQIRRRELKKRKTFTLTPAAITVLEQGTGQTGMSESIYVEQAIREKFAKDQLDERFTVRGSV